MKQIELIEKRKPREKHFLQEDGTIIAKIYDDDVHYLKDGKYEEIDNTLIEEKENYVNKSNSFKTFFGKEDNSEKIIKLQKDGHFINIQLKQSEKYLQKKLECLKNIASYKNVFKNIDLDYKILPTKVKESIIIKDRLSVPKDLTFTLYTDLSLIINDDKTISALNGNVSIFTITAPYMIDANNEIYENICYELLKNETNYELKLNLDVDWLKDSNRAYPVTIDPTITNSSVDVNVWDTYIFQGDTYINRNSQDILKAGVERVNGIDTVNRALIQFALPELGTGSQIVNARLNLTGYVAPYDTYDEDIVEVHRMTSNWNESDANWANQSETYDERVETCFYSKRSFAVGNTILSLRKCVADITSLVKKWYSSDLPNYGIMLKQSNEIYKTDYYPAFFSKDNSATSNNPKPMLEITYRNQNGIENYMHYVPFILSDGISNCNIFNGNLVLQFDIGNTKSLKSPTVLSIAYNTNDVVLNKNYGYGLGITLSLHRTIEKIDIDGNSYLQYNDEDGTIHYFHDSKTICNSNGTVEIIDENNTWYDEDGLDMIIVEYQDKYILSDKNNIKYEFAKINTNSSRLVKIIKPDNDEINITYTNNKITKVEDPDGDEINITYGTNIATIISPNKTISLNYNNEKLLSIISPMGSTSFEYNSNNLISRINDPCGKHLNYEYYSASPFRMKKISEYGSGNSLGNELLFEYNELSTTLTDINERITTYTFNSYGNIASTTNLKSGEFVKNAYGRKNSYGENYQEKNKKLSVGIPIQCVKNLINNSSFEETGVLFNAENGITLVNSTDFPRSGEKSLKATISVGNKFISNEFIVPKGEHYTFSAYFKSSCSFQMSISYLDENNELVENMSNIISSSDDYYRNDITIDYPLSASSDLKVKIRFTNVGICYIDDMQLEEGKVANAYNYVENSDFSNGFDGWTTTATEYVNNEFININNRFEITTLSDGNKALKIKMDPKYNTSLSRHFNLSGNAGDNYTICFWYKNGGITGSDEYTYNNAIINFEYEYGQCAFPSFKLNPNENEWQFFSYTFVAEQNYTSLNMSIFQSFNANDLYVTNICLYKNINSIHYDYDINGNIISTTGYDSQQTDLKYDDKDRICKIEASNGKKFSFEYDNTASNKILSQTAGGSITSEFVYDNNNLVVSKLINKGINSNIVDGLYKIRLKGTNKYLKMRNKNLIIEDENYNTDLWKIIPVESNNFKICHPVINNTYFNASNNSISLSQYNSTNSLFKFEVQSNSSYLIKYNNSQLYLKYNNNGIVLEEKNDSIENYQFYLEKITDKLFIETSANYSTDGKRVKSEVDTLLHLQEYNYDSNNNLLSMISNSAGNKKYYTYNSKELLTNVTNGDKLISYSYNQNNLLSKIELNNKEYNVVYDEFLNIKNIKLGTSITLAENEYGMNNGNLERVLYSNNNIILYGYDEFDRLNLLTKMDDIYHSYYGNNGHLAKIISNNDVAKYVYDDNQKLCEYQLNDFRVKYTYDNLGNVTLKKYLLSNNNFNLENTYDINGKLIQTINDNDTLNYSYDCLNRLIGKTINNNYSINYTYVSNGNRTSTLFASMSNNGDVYKYKYNKQNKITNIYRNDILVNRYIYNQYGELIREDNYLSNITVRYKYDLSGNILSRSFYKLNTFELVNIIKYYYNNANWPDQLTKIDNEAITYDAIGNPLTIGNKTLTWINGRELKSFTTSNLNVEYKYDHSGIRRTKKINNQITDYYYEGDLLSFETTNNEPIYYIRNDIDDLVGIVVGNNKYYYVKNIQNDIIGLINSNGSIVCKYLYDAWGNIVSIEDAAGNDISGNASHIANINPFRYRSYYYDKETQLYYLNKRYYNPAWGRFLNSDNIIVTNDGKLGYNLYSYANNDPINNYDDDGQIIGLIINLFSKKKKAKKTETKKVTAKKTETKKPKLVVEGGVGFGFGIGLGQVANIEAYHDMTSGYDGGEKYSGSSMSASAKVNIGKAKAGVGVSVDHKDHNDYDGDDVVTHSNPFNPVWNVIKCEDTTISTLFGVTQNNIGPQSNLNNESDDFIGIDASVHFVIGGHIKIGVHGINFSDLILIL